jgi:hypothetical protein
MDKPERLRVFFDRLNAEQPARTSEEARSQLEAALNRVEDEHSGISYSSQSAAVAQSADGRMYPPRDDNERGSTKTFRRFRTKGNVVMFGINGSIRIDSLHGDVLLDKPGADGRRVEDL